MLSLKLKKKPWKKTFSQNLPNHNGFNEMNNSINRLFKCISCDFINIVSLLRKFKSYKYTNAWIPDAQKVHRLESQIAPLQPYRYEFECKISIFKPHSPMNMNFAHCGMNCFNKCAKRLVWGNNMSLSEIYHLSTEPVCSTFSIIAIMLSQMAYFLLTTMQ